MYVCRMCIQWTASSLEVDDLASFDVMKQVFGLDLEHCPGLPRYVCESCSMLLDDSLQFYKQVVEAEKTLLCLQATGQLEALLAKPKQSGDLLTSSISHTKDNDNEPPMKCSQNDGLLDTVNIKHLNCIEKEKSEAPSGDGPKWDEGSLSGSRSGEDDTSKMQSRFCEAQQNETTRVGDDFNSQDAVCFDEQQNEILSDDYEQGQDVVTLDEIPDVPKELLVDISIEAVEELEIISAPLKSDTPKSILEDEMDGTVPNMCYICDMVFSDRQTLETHLNQHVENLPYRCEQCSTCERPIVLQTVWSLNQHLKTHTYKYVCNQCPWRYRKHTAWYEHNILAHSGEGSFTCHLCGKILTDHRKFFRHLNFHRNKELQRYKCGTCAKAFQSSSLLKRHELIHSGQAPFRCSYCSKGFNHEWNYKMHQQRHSQRDVLLHKCAECSMEFPNILDWRRHMKEHFPEDQRYFEAQDVLPESLRDAADYPNWCAVPGCTYQAASRKLMWLHYRKHFKAFQCEHCSQKFISASILQQHVDVTHRGIRPHECEVCGKRFGYRHKLREHRNKHASVQNLKCRYCDKKFTFSSHLTVHERVHTGVRPYQCDLCGSKFKTSSAFAKHQRQLDPGTGLQVASRRCVQLQLKQRQKQSSKELTTTECSENEATTK